MAALMNPDGAHASATGESAATCPTSGPDLCPEDGLGAQVRRLVAGHERRLVVDGPWLCIVSTGTSRGASRQLAPHGWKLHLSARADDLPRLLELALPVVLAHDCDAKLARDIEVLREMNAGVRGPALVGKAVTVYPRHPERVSALGTDLAQRLAGLLGPRVLSDRRIRPDAPVYYRYGPLRADGDDASALVMTGPGGESFPGRAGPRYRQPPWASDPFQPAATATAAAPVSATTRLIGGRHRLTVGIVRSPHGDVYRALDTETGSRVIVKQARAHVGEDAAGVDARGRLRHEHAVLAALSGLDGVPRIHDHLRHGDDEYLVTTDCGPHDLRRDVLAHGPYAPDATTPSRNLAALARRLLRVLDGVHARGVVMCDLKPSNVVLDEHGVAHLVDFGIGALHGERPAGATPGYSMPVLRADRAPQPADDLYALGATLYFALTGMDPVVVDRDRDVNRERTLQCLDAVLPDAAHHWARALVAGMLDPDPVRRTACADRLRGPVTTAFAARAARRLPRITGDLLEDLIAHTVANCAEAAAGLPEPPHEGSGGPGHGLTLYDGAAGLGLELLHHRDRPGVSDAVAELARRTAEHPALPALSAALYTGRTGVDLFLERAAAATGSPAVVPAPGRRPYDTTGDQIGGASGVGTGLLALARQAYATGRVEEGEARIAAAGECVRALLRGECEQEPAEPQRSAADSAAAFTLGFAHGRAGVVHFLSAYHRRTGDPDAGAAARRGLAELTTHTPRLLTLAARPEAHRRYGSWCRGLAGIGALLIEEGAYAQDPFTTELGVRCAWASRRLAPRMSPVSQCCGLAGVGELLLDAAAATGDAPLHTAAEDVAGLILARSGGTGRRPVFADNTLTASSAGWASGSAGVLSFLRRLRDRGGPRLWSEGPPGTRSTGGKGGR
ncbi:class IV lanthionine synthetase LanL [Streptomyces sp. NPDC050504]|uniref:class IV lanthionine synthetase LanL n=1 Tax=Streptomyces sp. NPDC050504 TaxID=3365618 RepID=UPI00379EA6A3